MKNKGVIVAIAVLLVIVLAAAIWYFFFQTDAPSPTPTLTEAYSFPTSAEEIDWEDREIFKYGLVKLFNVYHTLLLP